MKPAAGIVGVALLIVLAGWFGSAAAQITLDFEPIAAGLSSPIGLAHAGDGSGRLFIALQGGQILIHTGTQVLATPFLDIASLISCCGERGLLSVVFHPHFAQNRFFYVSYTDTSGGIVLARYHVSDDPSVADPSSAQILLSFFHPFANHNAGQLAFGPDGFLYMSSGDGGGDPAGYPQDLGSLLGKVLRLDVDGAFPYAIPPTNPFRNTPGALPEIWAYGLRNPWRFSFDRQTGDLFIADVGHSRLEELNVQPAGSAGGQNYGWRLMEGTLCFIPATGCNDGNTLTLPVIEYDHSVGCAIIGGYRYRGGRFPQLVGRYFYGDFCSGQIFAALPNGPGWTGTELLDTTLNISAFGEDEAGEIYVVQYSFGADGAVYRLIETSQSFALTVNRVGTGTGTVASAPPGIRCGGVCSAPFGGGAMVTLTATPDIGSIFAGWSGGGCGGTGQCTVTIASATAVTATFTEMSFTLSVVIAGPGGGTVTSAPAGIACPPTCAAVYPANLVVALSATPNASSVLGGWSGGGCSGTGACNVTLGADTTVTATFSTMTTLSVSVTGPGTVTSQPAGIACPPTCSASFTVGMTIKLAAAAAARATFAGWSGACAGTALCTLTMTGPRSVGATFATSFSGTFTDDPLAARVTLVKAVHVTELRLAIDQERTRRGLAAFGWTDPVLTPGITVISALHLAELRAALNAAYQAASRTPPTYTDLVIVARSLAVRVVHLHELRAAVRALRGA
jgi:glucose/arabinose dehydrogenase